MRRSADIRRAEVTSTSPLEVRFADATLAVPAVATDVTVSIFDEVLVAYLEKERQVYILVKLT